MKREESLATGVLIRLLKYLRGCAALIMIDAVVYTGAFWVIGVPYAPVFGIISGLAVLVPMFGSPAAALLTLAFSWYFGLAWWQFAFLIAVYLLYGALIEPFVVYPALVGGVLGLSRGESLLAIVIGVLLGGLPGMLLALPIAGILKYIVQRMRKDGPPC